MRSFALPKVIPIQSFFRVYAYFRLAKLMGCVFATVAMSFSVHAEAGWACSVYLDPIPSYEDGYLGYIPHRSQASDFLKLTGLDAVRVYRTIMLPRFYGAGFELYHGQDDVSRLWDHLVDGTDPVLNEFVTQLLLHEGSWAMREAVSVKLQLATKWKFEWVAAVLNYEDSFLRKEVLEHLGVYKNLAKVLEPLAIEFPDKLTQLIRTHLLQDKIPFDVRLALGQALGGIATQDSASLKDELTSHPSRYIRNSYFTSLGLDPLFSSVRPKFSQDFFRQMASWRRRMFLWVDPFGEREYRPKNYLTLAQIKTGLSQSDPQAFEALFDRTDDESVPLYLEILSGRAFRRARMNFLTQSEILMDELDELDLDRHVNGGRGLKASRAQQAYEIESLKQEKLRNERNYKEFMWEAEVLRALVYHESPSAKNLLLELMGNKSLSDPQDVRRSEDAAASLRSMSSNDPEYPSLIFWSAPVALVEVLDDLLASCPESWENDHDWIQQLRQIKNFKVNYPKTSAIIAVK